MILTKSFRFEASHRLPHHQGKCARLHGHSWILDVTVEGPVDPSTGMVMDFYLITKVMQPIIDDLDHRHLGTWEGVSNFVVPGFAWSVSWLPFDFNATSENLLLAIAKHIGNSLEWFSLTIHETCTSQATLTKGDYERT